MIAYWSYSTIDCFEILCITISCIKYSKLMYRVSVYVDFNSFTKLFLFYCCSLIASRCVINKLVGVCLLVLLVICLSVTTKQKFQPNQFKGRLVVNV